MVTKSWMTSASCGWAAEFMPSTATTAAAARVHRRRAMQACSLWLHDSASAQPVGEQRGPLRQRLVVVGQTDAVRALLEDVQFGWNRGASKRQVIVDAVFSRNRCVGVRVKQER